MQQIKRNRPLTNEEVTKYKTIREQVDKELPELIKRHNTIITVISLRKRFGSHAPYVLNEFLERLPKKGKERQKFKIIQELPSVKEFNIIRAKKFTVTLDSLISSACSELEELKNEFQEWFDNMPENLQSSQKGNDLESVIDVLEQIQQPDVPDWLGNLETIFIPPEKLITRLQRRDNAVEQIHNVLDLLGDVVNDDYTEQQQEELATLITELDEIFSEAENFDMPAMFG